MAKNGDKPFGERLGLMYKRFALDGISDLGYAVSHDFSYRPELYQGVGKELAIKITELQSQIEKETNRPGKETRAMLYKPIFGTSDIDGKGNDGSTYQRDRMALIAAAADFAENAQSTSFPCQNRNNLQYYPGRELSPIHHTS